MSPPGIEAVSLSAVEDFDVILMGVQMPGMDGMQATKAIRDRERATGKHVTIIAVTAHAMAGDREACIGSRMNG
jgi:CheY-like chemotaxis protein